MATGAVYSEELKAQVMAALLSGQSINSVAREYNLPKGTVSSWLNRRARPAAEKGSYIDTLLVSYVEENLVTLREQAIFFRDVDWLKQQEASQLAVLHGVIADKTIRLLEAHGGEPET
jgi:transposase-like protein